jgi:imidazolonepropionase
MPVLRNISQLATCPPGNPQHDAGLIEHAALAWRDGIVRWAGRYCDLPAEFGSEPVVDCEGRLVIPGLVDCHTHLCFAGWRGDEFEARLQGATYQEIAAAGGGIERTVTATRGATAGELQRTASAALDAMLRLGVTTVECKSGYGLDEANELKQLEVYRRLDRDHPVDLVPTFLGAHVIPPEHRRHPARYVNALCETIIPRVAALGLAQFCDIFVEEGAYSVEEQLRPMASD